MKTFICLLLSICFCLIAASSPAQILDIRRAVKNKIINKVNNNIDRSIDKQLNKAEDAVVDSINKKNGVQTGAAKTDNVQNDGKAAEPSKDAPAASQEVQPAMQVYSKYDFVPGEKVIFFDDFSIDNTGDFPVAWNTNGSGEVVTNSLYPGKWFKITNSRGAVCLDEPVILPENYTIEFDVVPQKDPSNNQSTSYIFLLISTPKPKDIVYGLARPGANGIKFEFAYDNYYANYYSDGSPELSGNTPEHRQEADKLYRISIWVQKERIRLYQNEVKLFDLPKAMNKNLKYNMIRFQGGVPMISNVRIATGLPDMRNKLLTEGKLVTYGIYFDVNSDKIKPESYGTLKGIASVLSDNPDVKVKIFGYTDSDGNDAANLDLSKRRAASVRNELSKSFAIDPSRMETDGKGESEPIAPNDTPTNKALNRRVEFIKL